MLEQVRRPHYIDLLFGDFLGTVPIMWGLSPYGILSMGRFLGTVPMRPCAMRNFVDGSDGIARLWINRVAEVLWLLCEAFLVEPGQKTLAGDGLHS